MADPSPVVFLGNLPFDVTEEQLRDVFGDVGPIVEIKLVFDRETGRPRGYGFCEYADVETASSAEILQNIEIGGRVIWIDFADPVSSKQNTAPYKHPNVQNEKPHHNQSQGPGAIAPPNQMEQTVASLDERAKIELLAQMKEIVIKDKRQARVLLQSNPQLAYALLHILVDQNKISEQMAVAISSAENPTNFEDSMQDPSKSMLESAPLAHAAARENGGNEPRVNTNIAINQSMHLAGNTRKQQGANIIKAEPEHDHPIDSLSQSDNSEPNIDQQQLLMQVVNLTPEQIEMFPPDQQQQIVELKAQILAAQSQN